MTAGLIGTGLIGIIIAAFSITLNSFQQSSRALAQKMEIAQLQANLKGRLAEGALCECNLSQATAESAGSGGQGYGAGSERPQLRIPLSGLPDFSLTLHALYGRCTNNSPSNPIIRVGEPVADSLTTLGVQEIRLAGLSQVGATTFSAELRIHFNPEGLAVGRKPISIPLSLQTQVSGGQARLLSCTTVATPDEVSGIPGTLAGDPGTPCQYGLNSNAIKGLTMYSPDPLLPPSRKCCVTSALANGEYLKCR